MGGLLSVLSAIFGHESNKESDTSYRKNYNKTLNNNESANAIEEFKKRTGHLTGLQRMGLQYGGRRRTHKRKSAHGRATRRKIITS